MYQYWDNKFLMKFIFSFSHTSDRYDDIAYIHPFQQFRGCRGPDIQHAHDIISAKDSFGKNDDHHRAEPGKRRHYDDHWKLYDRFPSGRMAEYRAPSGGVWLLAQSQNWQRWGQSIRRRLRHRLPDGLHRRHSQVGAIQDEIYGDYFVLASKAVLDLIIILVMTAFMGKGCLFSAIPVGLFQDFITLLARLTKPFMTESAPDNLSLTNSILIFCVGVNLIWGKKVMVANMLPTLVMAMVWAGIGS